jgi:pilus assembly protein Flp/PilA
MFNTFRTLIADENGATAIEYGLIAGLVSVAAITALTTLGDSLEGMFEHVASEVDAATNG